MSHLLAQQIEERLSEFVIGQKEAKRGFSMLLSLHTAWAKRPNDEHAAPNGIFVGPTGCGKTHTIRIASRILKLPVAIVDTTLMVPSGIVGLQVEHILMSLVTSAQSLLGQGASDSDAIQLAERGIIFFDEFDKIAVRDSGGHLSQMHLDVQRRLLKLVEGAPYPLTLRETNKISKFEGQTIDTRGILVLAGGAFTGISDSEIRRKRPSEIEWTLSADEAERVVSSDLEAYGLMPELVGRLPVLIEFEEHDFDSFWGILENGDVSPLTVWNRHFESLGKSVKFDDSFKKEVVRRALALNLGARGLSQIIFTSVFQAAYVFESSDDKEIVITDQLFERR